MPVCKNCGTSQLQGTIFCDECGANLLTEERAERDTRSLKSKQARRPEQSPPPPTSNKTTPEAAPERGQPITTSLIIVTIRPGGRQQIVDIRSGVLVGRAHDNGRVVPDIDLTQDGGFDAGISRRHAMISLRNGICIVEDLESSNGTFVNGRRLLPHQPFPLHNSDELRLGTITLHIEASA